MGPRDPALIEALAQAQTAAARLVEEARTKLEAGMSRADIGGLLERQARERQVRLVAPPIINLGVRAAGFSPLDRERGPLEGPTLVTIDVQVRAGDAAGDYARTLQFGDDGRLWFYRRLAYKVYESFTHQLEGCRTERDAWTAAHDCAHLAGARLIGPAHTLGHHIIFPGDRSPLFVELMGRRERLEHVLRARLPLGLLSPKLRGVWSLEPVFEVDRHLFRFEDLWDCTGDSPRRLGEIPGWEG